MQVFCPSCGQRNEARPGDAQVMCTTCTTVFDAPRSPEPEPQPIAEPRPAGTQARPQSPRYVEAERWQVQRVDRLTGVPSIHFGSVSPLAIGALVSGVMCSCIPVVGPALAIGLGVKALTDMRRDPKIGGKVLAVVGIVLGGLGLLGQVLRFIISLVDQL